MICREEGNRMVRRSSQMMEKLKRNRAGAIGVCLILFFQFVFYKNVLIGGQALDSPTYLTYRFSDFVNLRPVVNGRTPGYPFFLQGFHLLLGDKYALIGAAAVQIIISLGSVFLLYKTIQKATKNRGGGVSLATAVLYGCSPHILGWNALIMTESLSISYVAAFLYLMVSYIIKPEILPGAAAILLTLAATFIKPALLPFDIALLLFWLLRYLTMKKEQGLLRILISGSLIAMVGILCYSAVVYRIWGTFALTNQGPRHLLAACLSSGLYRAYPDPAIVAQISQIFAEHHYDYSYETTTPIINLLEACKIDIWNFGISCVKEDPIGYIKYLFRTAVYSINELYEPSYNQYTNEGSVYVYLLELQKLLFSGLKRGHLYLAALIGGIVTWMQFFCRKQIAWIHFGIFALLTVNLIYIYIGTYAEFMRSTVYLTPFVYLSMGVGLQYLLDAGYRRKEK